MRTPLVLAAVALAFALSACDSKNIPAGERSPVFAAPAAPVLVGKPLKVKASGSPIKFERVYRADIGSSPDSRAFQWPAIAANGKIFSLDGVLVASGFDVDTGLRLWRSKRVGDGDSIWFGDIAYGDGAVFAVDSGGHIAKFSAASGERLKDAKLPVRLKSGAAFCAGRVFFAGDENELYAIDATTLEPAFTHRALSEPFQFVNAARPLCEGGKVFAAFSNGELHAIDAKTGKVLWLASVSGTRSFDSFADVVARPVAAGKAVVAKSFYGPMRAFDISTGKELWKRPAGGAAAPLYFDGVLFDVSGREFCALSAATGATFYCVGLEGKRIYFSPLMAGGELLLARDDGYVEVRSPDDGSLIRKVDVESSITTDPFIYDALLFLQRKYSISAFR